MVQELNKTSVDGVRCRRNKKLTNIKRSVPGLLSFPTKRSGMQSAERNRMKIKFSFRSVRSEVTVDSFPQNCHYPFLSKVRFQAEGFRMLTIHSVLSEKDYGKGLRKRSVRREFFAN
uniref:Uncharacterized protein n=1 Tax=Romanomermis culicivorax TaxID=13658 RepID=A0A915JDM7_ROMCU